MNKNCRFNRSFVRKDKTYTLSFKGLSKQQADIICHMFKSLHHVGVLLESYHGFTTPRYELRCSIPLPVSFDKYVVPASALSGICACFGNVDIPCKDYVLSVNGELINHLKLFGYEY